MRAAMSEGRTVVVDRRGRVRVAARSAQLRLRRLVQHAGISGAQPRRARRGHRRQPQRRRALRSGTLGRRPAAWTFEYGGRYAHYDYLEERALLQPARQRDRRAAARYPRPRRASRSVGSRPAPKNSCRRARRDRGCRRSARSRRSAGRAMLDAFRVERARSLDIAIEREFDGAYVFGVRRFYQTRRRSARHAVRPERAAGAALGRALLRRERRCGRRRTGGRSGWAPLSTGRVRGSLEYSRTSAHWLSRGDIGGHRRLGAGGDSRDHRRTARRHDVDRDRHSRNRDARVRALPAEHRVHARARRRSVPGSTVASTCR